MMSDDAYKELLENIRRVDDLLDRMAEREIEEAKRAHPNPVEEHPDKAMVIHHSERLSEKLSRWLTGKHLE